MDQKIKDSAIGGGSYSVESRIGINLEQRKATAAVLITAFQPRMIAHPDDARSLAQNLLDGADAAERDALETQAKIDSGELDDKLEEAKVAVAEQTAEAVAAQIQAPTNRPSDLKLTDALVKVGQLDLAGRAAAGEWNEYFGPHALPQNHLVELLHEIEMAERGEENSRSEAINELIERVKTGDFDATKAESDEWAGSTEGQESFAALTSGKLGKG